MSRYIFPDPTDPENIQACKEWLARRKAWLDQKEKQFEDQYSSCPPRINRERMDDLEAWKFRIEMNEYELEETLKAMQEGEDFPED